MKFRKRRKIKFGKSTLGFLKCTFWYNILIISIINVGTKMQFSIFSREPLALGTTLALKMMLQPVEWPRLHVCVVCTLKSDNWENFLREKVFCFLNLCTVSVRLSPACSAKRKQLFFWGNERKKRKIVVNEYVCNWESERVSTRDKESER